MHLINLSCFVFGVCGKEVIAYTCVKKKTRNTKLIPGMRLKSTLNLKKKKSVVTFNNVIIYKLPHLVASTGKGVLDP